jgi:hypothetical protein
MEGLKNKMFLALTFAPPPILRVLAHKGKASSCRTEIRTTTREKGSHFMAVLADGEWRGGPLYYILVL